MSDTLPRDIAALHTAHTAGTWHPTDHETALAADLARAQWTAPLLRAALRRDDVGPGGALAKVLEAAAAVLEAPRSADRMAAGEILTRLRALVDELAHGQERMWRPSAPE